MSRPHRSLAFALLAAAFPCVVQAGLFDDDEARRQLVEHKKQTQTAFEAQGKTLETQSKTLETQARAQLELSNQITTLSEELARLRGQPEVMTHEMENARKRMQDLYADTDARLRQLETAPKPAPKEEKPIAAVPEQAVVPDPAQENTAYEAALALLRASKFKEAAGAFEAFLGNYGKSTLAPNAQFWMANAWAAQGNCKKAIELQQQGLEKWPNSNKAPDALLAIAGCHKELGHAADYRKTLELLVRTFPNTGPGETARQRLGKK